MAQLEYRIDNLNRSIKREPAAATATLSDETPKRAKIKDSYGCISFEPSIPKDVDRLGDLQFKQRRLKQSMKERPWNMMLVRQDMTDTYCLQRKSINDGMDIQLLQEEWPFLFQTVGMKVHYDQLVGKPLIQTLVEAYSTKVPHILSFMKNCKKLEVMNVLKEINIAKEKTKNNTSEGMGVVTALAAYFGDDLITIIQLKDASIFNIFYFI